MHAHHALLRCVLATTASVACGFPWAPSARASATDPRGDSRRQSAAGPFAEHSRPAVVAPAAGAPPAGVPAVAAPRAVAPGAWWQTAAAVGGFVGVMALDVPLRDVYRQSRSRSTDAVARVARSFGGPWTYASVGAGLLVAGVATGDGAVAQAGGRVGTTLIATGVLVRAGKYAAGRERPAGGRGNRFFEPLSDKTSLPSGHTAMAFALATSLADEIDRPWATAVLYTAATATAWSRLNDDIHWTSDVLAGAVLGHQCAKFVGRHLRFRGDPPPTLLPYDGGVAIAWTVGL